MFMANEAHLQTSLFGFEGLMNEAKLKRLRASREYSFYELLFCRIDEDLFSCLYSDKGSRPNTPVNVLVGAIILQHSYGCTSGELFDCVEFDLLTRWALGLHALDMPAFCAATYYNFQNRLASHCGRTGENLLERVFDRLTAAQLKELNVKTSIQRMDSFHAMSNIRQYSRTQLLVEVLIRMQRILDEEDKVGLSEQFDPFCRDTSNAFMHNLKKDQLDATLLRIGQTYQRLLPQLRTKYGQTEAFATLERVYLEHFAVVEEKVEIRAAKHLPATTLQSPDDLDATYARKPSSEGRGQSVNVCETAHPDNVLNLIVDVAVAPNARDDSRFLGERIDVIKEKTPELVEMHTDGGYGSAANDVKLEQHNVTQIQTAVRGCSPAVTMEYATNADGGYTVRCPKQQVQSCPTPTKVRAEFDPHICGSCEHAPECPARPLKEGRPYFYFDEEDVRRARRIKAIHMLPPERRSLRSNVEATMKEFTAPFNHMGKLRVRGRFKTTLYAIARAIGINFGRIWRYLTGQQPQKPRHDPGRGPKGGPFWPLACPGACLVQAVSAMLSALHHHLHEEPSLLSICPSGTF